MAVQIRIGCDPEMFLRRDGKFVSAHDILPGTKVEPYKVQKGAVQVDGVAAEFNTDPAETADQFVLNVKTVRLELQNRVKDAELVAEPYAVFEPTYFNSLPEEVRELGCNPDYNAWTGEVNPAPSQANPTMRTASGHIHIGWCSGVNPHSKIHFEDCRTVIKQLDYFLGIYSLLWDPDNTRRSMYGKAGAFRPKPYGCEYRVMSNAWLRSPKIQKWIFNSAVSAVNKLMGPGKSLESIFGAYAQEVIDGNTLDWTSSVTGPKVILQTGLMMPDTRILKPMSEEARQKYAKLASAHGIDVETYIQLTGTEG